MELLAGEWLALFNFATLPFYWAASSPSEASPTPDAFSKPRNGSPREEWL